MKTITKSLIFAVIFLIIIGFRISGQSYSSTTIYTPRSTSVTAYILTSGEFTQQEKNYWKDYWLDYYDNRIDYLDEATLSYNCHAYAWWITAGGGSTLWINHPEEDKFWNDGSYSEVSSQVGATKVSYGAPCWYYSQEFDEYANWCDHSAVTTGTEDYFTSKWGPYPLFSHDVNDCPYDPQHLHYYILRPKITGTDLVCSSGAEFTIVNLPTGATISWGCSENITRVSSQGSNPCEFEANSNGEYGTIEATITYNNDEIPLYDKTVWVGLPGMPTTNPSGYPTIQMYYEDFQLINLASSPGASAASADWWSTGSITPASNPSGSHCLFEATDYGTGNFYVQTTNDCGDSDIGGGGVFVNSGGKRENSLQISPNPATFEINISVTKNKSGTENVINIPSFRNDFDLVIYNSFGSTIFTGKMYEGKIKINVSGWQKGTYLVNVKNKDANLTARFLIE